MAMIPKPGTGASDQPERDARLDAAYRAGAQSQPPERLDDAIRAAARRAVAAGPRHSSDRLRRWSIPLSLAAVVVLSVTLVTMMREEGADRWINENMPLTRTPPPIAAAEAPATVPGDAPAPPAMPALKAAPPVPMAPAESQQRALRVEPPATGLRGPEHRERFASDIGSRAKSTAGAAALAEADADLRRDSARDAAAPPRLQRSASAPAPAAMAEMAASGATAPVAALSSAKLRDALWQDLEGEPAARWLDRIRELRKAGRAAESDRLAVEFRRRFPDAVLPDDLR